MKNVLTYFFSLTILLTSCKMIYEYEEVKNNLPKAETRAEYIDKVYKEVAEALPEAQVKLVEDSIKVIFNGGLLFDVGQIELNEKAKNSMKRLANVLNKYNKTTMLILGHTDNQGNADMNQKLSEDRALSSKQELIENGVSDSRIETWGMGDSDPLDTNNTKEGRSNNRRVEFVVLFPS